MSTADTNGRQETARAGGLAAAPLQTIPAARLEGVAALMRTGAPLLADGAMGTYFSRLTGQPANECELAGLRQPDVIRRIHDDYLAGGARVLRSNTFALQPSLCDISIDHAATLIAANYQIAVAAADAFAASSADGGKPLVLADLGPNPLLEHEEALQEYQPLLDAFVECGARRFLFETFPDTSLVPELAAAVRARVPDALVIASLAFSADGYTRKGQSVEAALLELGACADIDIIGMNCGIGPVHMLQLLSRCGGLGKPLSLMPNAGYPAFENQQSVYAASADYFAEATALLARETTVLIGGCCGTTPEHIRALGRTLAQPRPRLAPLVMRSRGILERMPDRTQEPAPAREAAPRPLADAFARPRKVMVCEMDPPRDSRLEPLIEAARTLATVGIDAMTLADTPLSRVRLDPVIAGARIQRETGLPALPHLCCRDRNVNSLRATLLALHSERIRQVLLITGDPVPEQDRGSIKPVFNLNSVSLLELAASLNRELFAGDELLLGAAFDPNVPSPDVVLKRAERKIAAGARFFLTQPVYSETAVPVLKSLRALGAKVLCGLMPPVSYRNIQYLANEVPGIRIPSGLLARFKPDMTREDALEAGLAATLSAAQAAAPAVDGFYLISPFNRTDIAVRLAHLIAEAGLL